MVDRPRMRVLHIINSLETGGAEKLLIDSLSLYRERGVQVDLLLLNGRRTPFFEKIEANSTFRVICLANKSIYNPLLSLKIVTYLRKYDIVHGHLFPVLYWLALAKLISFGKGKIVYTEHSTSNRRRSHTVLKYIDRIVYSMYDKVITISDEVDERLKEHLRGNSDKKIVLVNNGIDLEGILQAKPIDDSFGFDAKSRLIIQVSSFRYPKDQNTIIRALSILPERFKLLLVGIGELMKESEELATSLGLLSRVRFLGTRMDVPDLLKRADYIVLSSAHEGLSLSSIEGLASGTPFIASNVPGLTEIVEGAGVLFQYKNHEELAQIIIDLDNDIAYRTEIVRKGQNRSKQYDIRKMVDQYIETYKSVL